MSVFLSDFLYHWQDIAVPLLFPLSRCSDLNLSTKFLSIYPIIKA